MSEYQYYEWQTLGRPLSPQEMAKVEELYREQAQSIEHVDGLSMDMGDWRFNLRMSNTEPVVRLNVESRGDEALMRGRTEELLALLDTWA